MSDRIEDARQLVADALAAHGERRCRLFTRARRALYGILYTPDSFGPLPADVDLDAWLARDVNAPDVTEDERLVPAPGLATMGRAPPAPSEPRARYAPASASCRDGAPNAEDRPP